ncbi:Agmatinase, mitochondrial, partial [Stegodyphus mimosarum]
MMGCKIAHGTTFKCAVGEGLLDQRRVVQIGLRGTSYTSKDYQWSVDQ